MYSDFQNMSFFDIAKEANRIREELWDRKVFFNLNLHINPTNICKDVCKFCGFSASRKNPNPYTMTIDNILEKIRDADKNITEVHIVSAHNPNVGYNWYFDIFREIKKEFPKLHIKALTAAEINFLATEYNLSYDNVIDDMIAYGVDSMPGGGAEIFDENIRANICKGKVSSENWLLIHKLWHNRGKKSNATMLFGHIENINHRIDHMNRIRELQSQTGGFNAFIPLVYQTKNNYLNINKQLSANEILKTIAMSRIILDNVPHIKAYWVTSTLALALLAQEFGADDIDGTIGKESINSASGANSSNGINMKELIQLILDSNFIPVERDSLYNEIYSYKSNLIKLF